MKEVYDLDALRRSLIQIDENIKAWKEGLEEQRKKRAQYVQLIEEAEGILNLHEVGSGGSAG